MDNKQHIIDLLRSLSELVETDASARELMRNIISNAQRKKKEKVETAFNLFEVLQTDGDEATKARLSEEDTAGLYKFVKAHRLDPSGKALKWKDKERLISLIVTRGREAINKGKVFLK